MAQKTIHDPTRNLIFTENEKVIATFSDNLDYEATISKILTPKSVKLHYEDGIKKTQKIETLKKMVSEEELIEIRKKSEEFYAEKDHSIGQGKQREGRRSLADKVKSPVVADGVIKKALKKIRRASLTRNNSNSSKASASKETESKLMESDTIAEKSSASRTTRNTRSGKAYATLPLPPVLQKKKDNKNLVQNEKNDPKPEKKLKNNLTKSDMKRPSNEIQTKLATERLETSSFITVKPKVSNAGSDVSSGIAGSGQKDQETPAVSSDSQKSSKTLSTQNSGKNEKRDKNEEIQAQIECQIESQISTVQSITRSEKISQEEFQSAKTISPFYSSKNISKLAQSTPKEKILESGGEIEKIEGSEPLIETIDQNMLNFTRNYSSFVEDPDNHELDNSDNTGWSWIDVRSDIWASGHPGIWASGHLGQSRTTL